MVELVSIAGLVATVVSALVGVWLGHQLRERSVKKEWKRHRLSDQAREVRAFVRYCLRFAEDLCGVGEEALRDDAMYQQWLADNLWLVGRLRAEFPFGASVLIFCVDDDRLSGLLEEIRVILWRFIEYVREDLDQTRAPPGWGEGELEKMMNLATRVEARLEELMEAV